MDDQPEKDRDPETASEPQPATPPASTPVSAKRPFPSGAACAATTRLLAKFIAGELGDSHAARMRLHISQCPSCQEAYRSAMATVASLGRRVRVEREAQKRVNRHEGIKSSAFQATADRHAHRRFGLRLALLPAGMALLMILWRGGGGGTGLTAEWEAGEGWVAGQAMGEEQVTYVLSPGDWVETDVGARIRIVSVPGAELELVLIGGSQVQVENLTDRQLRLHSGSVRAEGACRVTTGVGVLEVLAGSATLRLEGRGFELECHAGELLWTGPAGGRKLSKGQSISDRTMLAHIR